MPFINKKILLLSVAALLCAGPWYFYNRQSVGSPSEAGSEPTSQALKDFQHPAVAALDVRADDPKSLEAALQRNPQHTPILMRLAEVAHEQGDLKKAAARLRQIMEIEPDNLEARLELGRTLYESGDVDGAILATTEILRKNPSHVDALYNLGAIYANGRQTDIAAGYWREAVRVSPESDSGKNAQRGLDVLVGKSSSIRDIPGRRDVDLTSIPDIPEHRGLVKSAPTTPGSGGDKQAIIDFSLTR
jgi:cytochrome c-type biogenesis protein CcmH/NrfG